MIKQKKSTHLIFTLSSTYKYNNNNHTLKLSCITTLYITLFFTTFIRLDSL